MSEAVIIALITSALSSGTISLITFLIQRHDNMKAMKASKHCLSEKMLLGLGHNNLIELCEKYLNNGFISVEEYEDMYKYLYEPYRDMGGNGVVEKLMNEVKNLPMRR